MNYYKIALVTLLSTGALFSCKKKDDKTDDATPVVTPTPTPASTVAKIKSESSTSNGQTTTANYTYDSNGRVTKISNGDGSSSTFEWSSTKCVEKDFESGSTTPASTITYDLNTSGQCTSQTDGASGSVTTYEYNTDGYQTKVTSTTSGTVSTVTYGISNGNQTSITTGSGSNSTTMTMDFFTDKTNTIGNINRGMVMMGKDSKNIPKKMSMSMLGLTVTVDITYEFDSKNRVTKMTQTTSGFGSSSSSSTSFTYVD